MVRAHLLKNTGNGMKSVRLTRRSLLLLMLTGQQPQRSLSCLITFLHVHPLHSRKTGHHPCRTTKRVRLIHIRICINSSDSLMRQWLLIRKSAYLSIRSPLWLSARNSMTRVRSYTPVWASLRAALTRATRTALVTIPTFSPD